jgi:hypothetical protein
MLLAFVCTACSNDRIGANDLAMSVDAALPDLALPDLALPDLLPSCSTLPDGTACGSGMHCGGGACRGDTVLLVAGPSNGGTFHAIGTSYQGGAWSAATQLGSDIYSDSGGGVAVTAGGTGVAVLRGNTNTSLESAVWNAGSWKTLVSQGTTDSFVSAPVAAGGVAMLVHQSGVGASTEYFAEWNSSGSSFSPLSQSTGTVGDNETIPVVVTTASGDPLVLFSNNTYTYSFTLRTGGVWSAVAALPSASEPMMGAAAKPAIAAARGIGTTTIVAVVNSGSNGTNAQYATFSSGAWTTAKPLVSDLLAGLRCQGPIALAGLPDGRVAMAYVATAGAIKVGFFDGQAFGAFTAVPMVTSNAVPVPLSLARGAYGSAVLELAYLDTSLHVEHTRLTSEAQWTWSTPIVVDATQGYNLVSLAVGP